MRIRISKGNIKMGLIPSVSLPAIKTCGNVPCTRDCYVVRNMYHGPYGKNIIKSHSANLELLTTDREEYFFQLENWILKHKPSLFRFHVSGDFIDKDHMVRTVNLARKLPYTGFLVFSKRHEWFPHPRMVPCNMALIASLWPGWSKRPKGYRVAFMQDGNEDRIPNNAIHCPGNCETCWACWSLRKLRRDVYFVKH